MKSWFDVPTTEMPIFLLFVCAGVLFDGNFSLWVSLNFCPKFFGYVKERPQKKTKVNLENYIIIDWETNNYIIYCPISQEVNAIKQWNLISYPVDTGRKLIEQDVQKTSWTSFELLMYVQFTFCVYGVVEQHEKYFSQKIIIIHRTKWRNKFQILFKKI